jgi:glyoxylase-like metal-dependent hydrolase (beta-lactamase superfamily II)
MRGQSLSGCAFFSIAFLLVAAASMARGQRLGEPIRPEWCRTLPRAEYKQLKRVVSADSWFEVYLIRPGVFAIYEPHQFEEVISYLILGNKRALLFDTGLGVGKISSVVRGLTPLSVIVVNSHTHFDHVGGNAEFQKIWNQDLPYTLTNARGGLNDYSRDALSPQRLCGELPKGVSASTFSTRPWRATHILKDGETIDLGNRKLQVLFTPGHTPDSLCLIDRKNKLLFTGDTYYPGPIYLFVPETDLAAYTSSIHRLAELAPSLKLLLPAHNVPFAEPQVLVRLDAALKAIQRGEVTPVSNNGRREYSFQGFSILLPEK